MNKKNMCDRSSKYNCYNEGAGYLSLTEEECVKKFGCDDDEYQELEPICKHELNDPNYNKYIEVYYNKQ